MTIETKMNAPSGANADARATATEMMMAFEALKATNDARIEEIEKRGAADPVLEAKLKKIEQSLDRQRTALERLALEDELTGLANRRAFTKEFDSWCGRARGSELRFGLDAFRQGLDAQLPAHGDDARRAHLAGGQYAHQAHGTVTDDDHGRSRPHACGIGQFLPPGEPAAIWAEDWRWSSLWHRVHRSGVPWLAEGDRKSTRLNSSH